VAVLWNAAYPGKALEWQDTQIAARALGVTLQSVEVRGPDDFDGALAAIARARPDALLTFADPLTLAHRTRIVEFAAQHRLLLMSEIKAFAEAGGLMTYGASLPDLFRRAADYLDRILKGAKPAELPVEQPTKFELIILPTLLPGGRGAPLSRDTCCPHDARCFADETGLLAGFGDAGRRAQASGQCWLEEVLRARVCTIGDHQEAPSRSAALGDVQALVTPPARNVGRAGPRVPGHTSGA
jgi:hypothetical protein